MSFQFFSLTIIPFPSLTHICDDNDFSSRCRNAVPQLRFEEFARRVNTKECIRVFFHSTSKELSKKCAFKMNFYIFRSQRHELKTIVRVQLSFFFLHHIQDRNLTRQLSEWDREKEFESLRDAYDLKIMCTRTQLSKAYTISSSLHFSSLNMIISFFFL